MKQKILLSIGLGFLLFLTGFLAGIFVSGLFFDKEENRSFFSVIREEGYFYTNPLLDCEGDFHIASKALDPIKHKVKDKINALVREGNALSIAVYYRDLNNGPWFGVQEDRYFAPASLLKLPLMLAIFKVEETAPGFLDTLVLYEKEAQLPEKKMDSAPLPLEYQPEEKLELGEQYTVADLVRRMVDFSDNDAFYTLLRLLDSQEVKEVHADLGLAYPSEETPEDFISAKSYASIFRVLYNASYLTREHSEMALEILSDVSYDKGLVAGVDEHIIVSNKFGVWAENPKAIQLHDCGIIYYPKHPYILCVFTKGTHVEKVADSIEQVSRVVFQEIQQKYKL